MKIEYRKGDNHTNADALSGTDCETCIQCQTIHHEPKQGKLKTKLLALMLQDDGNKWQNGCDEIHNIKSNREPEKSKRQKIIGGVI